MDITPTDAGDQSWISETRRIKLTERAVRWMLYIGAGVYVAFPAFSFLRISAEHAVITSVVWALVEFALFTVAMVLFMYPLVNAHDRLEEAVRRSLPPHEFDEDVKYWERGDTFIYTKGESAPQVTTSFLAFSDEGKCIVRHNDGTLEQMHIQDLDSYENTEYVDRVEQQRQDELRAKADSSTYARMLKRRRDFERESSRALAEIIESDGGVEELDRALDRSRCDSESTTRDKSKQALGRE